MGWQLDFLLPAWLTLDLMPVLASLKVDFTLAHMGMFLAKDGPAQPGFGALLDLLKNGAARTRQIDRQLSHSHESVGTSHSGAACRQNARSMRLSGR